MNAHDGELGNEVHGSDTAAAALFDRDGWVVGRGVLPVDVVREVRRPVEQELLALGLMEPDGADRFRWIADATGTAGQTPGSGVTMLYRKTDANTPLVGPGIARGAAQRLWDRPTALWANTALFLKFPDRCDQPSGAHVGHSDGWQDVGVAGQGEHFNLWIPLTRFDMFEGSMAILPGSHEQRPAELPEAPLGLRPEHVVGGPWRSTGFAVGDALLFRPDLLHAATANTSDDVRISIVIRGQDARIGLPPAAGMSADRTQPLSLVEACVLALLAVSEPSTTWQVTVGFAPRGLIGRYQPLPPPGQLSHSDVVSHALRLLRARDLADVDESGPQPLFRVTAAGRHAVDDWLRAPVTRSDQLATVLPLKLDLLARSDTAPDIAAQQAALDALADNGSGPQASWSNAIADAVRRMLADTELIIRRTP